MIYQRKQGAPFTLDLRWKGFERIQLSTGTTRQKRAEAMQRTLEGIKDAGRRDIFSLLASGRLSLADVHDDWVRNREVLEHRVAKAHSPELGVLLHEWYDWLEEAGTLSAKTRRPYAERTIARYRQSWQKLLAVLPAGETATLSAVTKGFIAEYRSVRKRAGTQAGTINRDLGAIQAFLRWVEDEKGIAVTRFRIAKEREPDGRERWLTSEEIAELRRVMDRRWWPLFYFLIQTGSRIGEAQGLRWADVITGLVSLNNRNRRLKTNSSTRQVPISDSLRPVLEEHKASVPHSYSDPVFPGELGDYRVARRVFLRAVKAARLEPVRIHDLRHTFGVHGAQNGVPLPRLQKLMGHASPVMTMRYMAHAPDSYLASDAALIDASMNRPTEATVQQRPMLLKVV
ncbi:MAG TPA: tyrosine-type recombinase/integrase [Bryobacteraceae bacterium]|nr:tyrosine-type recombinase/integrase [Bryobacteraceae bacterium]